MKWFLYCVCIFVGVVVVVGVLLFVLCGVGSDGGDFFVKDS